VLVNAAPAAAKVALANILDNAVKFSPLGGQVRLTAAATEDEAVITVSDAGPGVSPEDAERLFQPFYRGRASRSTGRCRRGARARDLARPRPAPGRPHLSGREDRARRGVQHAPAARLSARTRGRATAYFFFSRTSSSGADHG
jgi:hypothetical protein